MEAPMIVFDEAQRQSQKWIYILIVIIFLLVLFGIIQQVVFNKPFGSHPVRDWVLFVFLLIPAVLLIFLRANVLRTTMDEQGITYQFKPYHRNETLVRWDELERCYVRIYSPMKEFGGWGVRQSVRKDGGKALNVMGTYGIQLEFRDGKKLLLGTQKPGEAEKALAKVGMKQ
jgi:hypothetical protein